MLSGLIHVHTSVGWMSNLWLVLSFTAASCPGAPCGTQWGWSWGLVGHSKGLETIYLFRLIFPNSLCLFELQMSWPLLLGSADCIFLCLECAPSLPFSLVLGFQLAISSWRSSFIQWTRPWPCLKGSKEPCASCLAQSSWFIIRW